MLSATASLGLILLWDVEGGLTEIDKFLYSNEETIKVRVCVCVCVCVTPLSLPPSSPPIGWSSISMWYSKLWCKE